MIWIYSRQSWNSWEVSNSGGHKEGVWKPSEAQFLLSAGLQIYQLGNRPNWAELRKGNLL